MFHHMLNCTMTHKNRVSLVIKDYKLIEEFPDSDFFGPYKVKKSKLSGRICFKENSRTLKKLFRHYQPPSSSGAMGCSTMYLKGTFVSADYLARYSYNTV